MLHPGTRTRTTTYAMPSPEVEANPMLGMTEPASTNEVATAREENIMLRGGFTQADRMLLRQEETNRLLRLVCEKLDHLNETTDESFVYIRRTSRNTFRIKRIWNATLEIVTELMRHEMRS